MGIALALFGIAVLFLWVAVEAGNAPRDPDDDDPPPAAN